MTPRFAIRGFDFFSRNTRTRFPFRYGIASMTEVPHLFVRARLEFAGIEVLGVASEGLPPKWFTKNPATTFEQDLPEMRQVIGNAARLASQAAARPVTFFEMWRELYRRQMEWAGAQRIPPLLANLGVSLVERAVLDALCRVMSHPLHEMLRENALDIRLGDVYPELKGATTRDLLPARPLAAVLVRHTVGLADPLTPGEISEADRVNDGLPQDLESCIRFYDLRAFKIKLWADPGRDLARLRGLQAVIEANCRTEPIVTLDGNENFKNFETFREFWRGVAGDASLAKLVSWVSVIEQPVHRDHSLIADVGEVLKNWKDRPPLIIDESDGAVGDLDRALSLGYAGTSHKNCKGIVKGIANACWIEYRRKRGAKLVLTAEDLCNLGPVALLQDLAMVSLLGISHVERNGHHYFRGLTPWPPDWQADILRDHPDLYTRHQDGFARLHILEGRVDLGSVNAAPFGLKPLFDPSRFERV